MVRGNGGVCKGRRLSLEFVRWFRNEAVHTHTYHVPGNGMTTRERLPWRLTTITITTTTQKSSGKQKEKNFRIKKYII